MQGRLLLLLLGPVLAAGLSLAQPALRLTDWEVSASLSGHLALLTDPAGRLGIDEASGSTGWRPLPGGLSLGYTTDTAWLRVEVERDAAAPSTWLLLLWDSDLDDVRLWHADATGRLVEQRSGSGVPRGLRPIDYQTPLFRLELRPGRQSLFLRIRTHTPLAARLDVYRPETFWNVSRAAALAWGLFFGAIAAIVVFQLSFWVRTGERVSGWYALYIALYGTSSIFTMAIPQQHFGMPVPASDLIRGLTLCAAVGVGSVFNSLALELARVLPRFDRLFLRASFLTSAVAALLVVSGRYGDGASVAQGGGLVLIVLLLCVSAHLALRGHEPARLFLFSFGLFIAGVSLRFLRNLGVITPGPLVDNAVHFGALFTIVSLSYGLSGRFSRLKQQATRAQAEALEAEVAARTVALTEEVRRRGELEEKLRRSLDVERAAREVQRDFVAMVSHEFRTPLSIIDAVAQQLQASPDAPREKTAGRYEKIGIATDRMTTLVDEFLSADRLASDESAMDVRPSNLRLVIARAVAELPEGRVAVEAGVLPARFPCDPDLLQVALRNLLANADRHSPPDRPVSLTATATPDGGVEFAVRDEGTGIPPDELPHIFRKYFRGRHAKGGPGTGLGLYLVDRIARRHGGSVSVESTPGAGSTFRIQLPGTPAG